MKIHIVKKGNTLYELSKKYAIDLKNLVAMNPQIENPDQLEVGMKVIVPSTTGPNDHPKPDIAHTHIVVQGDTLWALSKKFNVSLQELIQANKHLKNPNALLTGEKVFIPRHEVDQAAAVPAPVFHNPGQIPTEPLEDAFAQENVPAVQASSFYDIPTIPETQFSQNMSAFNPSMNYMPTSNMIPMYGAVEQPNMIPPFGTAEQPNMMPYAPLGEVNMMPPFGVTDQANMMPPYGVTDQANMMGPYGAMEPSNMMTSNAAMYSMNNIPPYNCMNPCLIPLMYAYPYTTVNPYAYLPSQYTKSDCGCGGRTQTVSLSGDEVRNEDEGIRKPDLDEEHKATISLVEGSVNEKRKSREKKSAARSIAPKRSRRRFESLTKEENLPWINV